jgi:hypothetical protein
MAAQCCCTILELEDKKALDFGFFDAVEDIPPKFFDAVKADNFFYVLHPSWSDGRRLWERSRRLCRDGSLRQIATFGSWRVKPEGPR